LDIIKSDIPLPSITNFTSTTLWLEIPGIIPIKVEMVSSILIFVLADVSIKGHPHLLASASPETIKIKSFQPLPSSLVTTL
jgi:hypothetical protein